MRLEGVMEVPVDAVGMDDTTTGEGGKEVVYNKIITNR
jgi:hypothetical protein